MPQNPMYIYGNNIARSRQNDTGWGKSRFMVVSTWNTAFVLTLLFINYASYSTGKTANLLLPPFPVGRYQCLYKACP